MTNNIYYFNNVKTFANALTLASFNSLSSNVISPYINNIAVKINNNDKNYYSLKAWKYSNSLNNFNDINNIFQLEYKLYDNYLKINYLSN